MYMYEWAQTRATIVKATKRELIKTKQRTEHGTKSTGHGRCLDTVEDIQAESRKNKVVEDWGRSSR